MLSRVQVYKTLAMAGQCGYPCSTQADRARLTPVDIAFGPLAAH